MAIFGVIWNEFSEKSLCLVSLKKYLQENCNAKYIEKRRFTMIFNPPVQNSQLDCFEGETFILIGRIFNKVNFQSISIEEISHIIKKEKPHELSETYWGQYLFFDETEKENIPRMEITRDPIGQIPLFYARTKLGNIIFSSEIKILFSVFGLKREYNYNYLYHYILYGNFYSQETAFLNIYELPPGCELNSKQNLITINPVWDPIRYCNEPDNSRSVNLIETLKSSLKAWIGNYDNIVLSLSGGLDSSSLAYCLNTVKKNEQNFIAFNFFNSSVKASNEFSYAKKICEELQLELIDIDLINTFSFDPPQKNSFYPPNKPFPALINLRINEVIQSFFKSKVGSSILISGHGGDNLFMQQPEQLSIVDYLFTLGIKDINTKIKEIAGFYNTSYLEILYKNIAGYFANIYSHKKIFDRKNKPNWIQKDFFNDPFCFANPIYLKSNSIKFPGKFNHIRSILKAFPSISIDPIKLADPIFYPLLSQPLIEQVLSIPTYHLYHKDYDRYPFRRSISEYFKTDNVWRSSKGETTGHFQLSMKKNLNIVKSLCYDGHFCKSKFINEQEIKKQIMETSFGSIKNLYCFINLLSAEIFINYWENENSVPVQPIAPSIA